jgi:cytochrome c oxidase subunit 1/cytochrome c oxidase subunit I+III
MFPVFAAFYYWLPKMTGRMLNETAGKWSFWIMFVGFNLAFFPMQLMGLMGMTRRIYTYQAGLGWGPLNMLSTIGAFTLAFGILISILNYLWSMQNGPRAGANPWRADSLEWDMPSPPPDYATVHIPTVVSRHPLWDDHVEEDDPNNERVYDQGRLTLATTALDAIPVGLARMPEDNLSPFLLGLALTALFTAILLKWLWVAAAVFLVSFIIGGRWLWPSREQRAL